MESTSIIKLRSLDPYRHLFPKALAIDTTVKMGAGVSDTVAFIPEIVSKCRWQVDAFVNQELRGLSTYAACEKLWYFVKYHIAYQKDKRGYEQVRSPRRLIHDAKGDCDCFTTFIDTCLASLGIPVVINRITKYKENFFQHIYPIVPIGNGKYITMDCVVDKFNYEEPYSEKKDYQMDLQFLDGIDENTLSNNVDARDLLGWEGDMGELGKGFKFRRNSSAMPAGNQGGQGKKKGFQKIKNFAKRSLNIANKANPAAALLRVGILASMKLNIMKVPQRLKWAYLSEDEAKAKGADMSKFGKLKKVLYKIEQIFYSSGGKPENLRKAILTGRGNRHKEVSVNGFGEEFSGVNEFTPVSSLLGSVIYNDEVVNGLEGTEGLGSAVATGAAITAATTVMTAIAGLLKSIGNVFPHKKAGADFKEDGDSNGTVSVDAGSDDNSNSQGASNSSGSDDSGEHNNSSADNSTNQNENTSSQNREANQNTGGDDSSNSDTQGNGNTSNLPANQTSDDDGNANDDGGNERKSLRGSNSTANKDNNTGGGFKEFWDNNKKWIKPVGIGVVVVSALAMGYKSWKKKQAEKGSTKRTGVALHGVPRKKKQKKRKSRAAHTKQSIPLM